MSKDKIYDDHRGRWCYLLDPRCKGQLALALECTRLGMRMKDVGIVPHDEWRIATEEEISNWLSR